MSRPRQIPGRSRQIRQIRQIPADPDGFHGILIDILPESPAVPFSKAQVKDGLREAYRRWAHKESTPFNESEGARLADVLDAFIDRLPD
ncbi:hypothetical protein PSMK_05200 [Phycisphaera mikurensis NBRC 102666]|uniref:Uncharacterized protein n=1 Tax=Phycisphaera mikurensis (strain NBRC 102666 / KCTC 22515 / FYK2301M01) TaxID=1142394 RepID=I0IBP1_PHYMF|nr:hypothetical protein PSMK_05200 [Phycisphaera mikurensis NBRC 102666]